VAVAVLRDDLRPEVPEATPESYASLMVNCWDKDPTVRPKFLEIMTRLESFEEKSSTGWGGASTSSTMSGISGWGGGTSDKGSSSTGGSHSSNGTVCHACRVVPCVVSSVLIEGNALQGRRRRMGRRRRCGA
jgi:hypothetical protein